MAGVFDKLNLKGQTEILALNAPTSFEAELATLQGVRVARDAGAIDAITFALAFVTRQAEVDAIAGVVAAKARGDAVIWFAYPKGSSKRYRCEFNRDTGWAKLGEYGFEAVRQVAIDEDWSALRFRRVEYIKTMRRAEERAMTAQGKSRVTT
jgi:hypothetical protein